MVRWIDHNGAARELPVSPALLDGELYRADQFRTGNRYPQQRNYHGWFYFGPTAQHVWVESRLESSRLAHLEHTEDIVAIASQPMELTFSDGTSHVPDFIALHSDHRQTVYDVKPWNRMTKPGVADQFRKTAELCRKVGWGYRVLHEAPEAEGRNLTFLANFKHPGFRPDDATISRALAATPATVTTVATAMLPNDLPMARAQLFHLLWTRELHCSIQLRLSPTTLIEGPHS